MKKFGKFKFFSLFIFLTVALIFLGVNFLEADKPDKRDKPDKSNTEWIQFTGDLVGGQPVDGCCPNAGPFPPYTMTLNFPVSEDPENPIPAGTYEGTLFINNYGAGRPKDRQYIVQFGCKEFGIAIQIIGGVLDFDKWNKVLTVTFTEELCVDRYTGSPITEVSFILVRRAY